MPEPLLDLCDIGIMRESVGRRRCAQRMHTESGTTDSFEAAKAAALYAKSARQECSYHLRAGGQRPLSSFLQPEAL